MDTILARYMRLIHETVPDTGTHVFRGQSDAGWPLRSGASRRLTADGIEEDNACFLDEYLEYHRELLDRARRVAPYEQRGRTDSPLQLLARLQHFGAATGLLDFSYSPLVALWFACEDSSRDGKVFFVSHVPPNTAFVTPELEGQDIENTLSRKQDATGPRYVLWEPLVEGAAALRILGQRSVFVIGRPAVDDRSVDAVEIEAADKESLRAELEQLDVSERTIFRDLVGFCQREGANARRALPTTAAACLRRANGAYSQGEYQEAVEAYDRCLELREASETYFLRGNANAALGRHQEAIDDYGRALDSPDIAREESGSIHYPWFPSGIFFNRGNEQACLGNHVDAIEDYRRVTEADQQFMPTRFNCGNAYFMQQRYGDAVACYDEMIAMAPAYRPALINKALALVLQGKLDAAETCYRAAQRAGPLPNNTLEPLLELKTAFAGLAESGLTVEVVGTGDTLRATVRHPDCRGSGDRGVIFKGIHGSSGNMGGEFRLGGGKGFGGGPGVLVLVQGG